jgi:hypothetical protein
MQRNGFQFSSVLHPFKATYSHPGRTGGGSFEYAHVLSHMSEMAVGQG